MCLVGLEHVPPPASLAWELAQAGAAGATSAGLEGGNEGSRGTCDRLWMVCTHSFSFTSSELLPPLKAGSQLLGSCPPHLLTVKGLVFAVSLGLLDMCFINPLALARDLSVWAW